MGRKLSVRAGVCGLLAMAGLLLGNDFGQAQAPVQPYAAPPAAGQPQPDQPVVPQYPTIERRGQPQGPTADEPGITFGPRHQLQFPGMAPPPAAKYVPFVLTPEQAAQLDRVLFAWEERNKEVKSFECGFTCWKYDAVFGDGRTAKTTDQGTIKYAAPDKGLFKIDGERAEHWICDGRAIFEFKYGEKKLIEHRLPPELQGKAISDGPLPFVFGTEAHKLKQRYFMRVITPNDRPGEIWLEAFPRYQQQAAEFWKAELILKIDGMLPYAVQLYAPNKKDRTVYQFDNVVINRRLRFIEWDWFRVAVPLGWKRVIEDPPAPMQSARAPAGVR